jgi:hypothetical protein
MPDLPPDVRDRAAQAAHETYWGEDECLTGEEPKVWARVVDAVVEVLAADRGPSGDVWFSSQHVRELAAEYVTQRDALKARVAELREDARRDSHDYELLRRESEQLREALGMARKEYGGKNIGKNIADLNEYDRLRLAANGFQAMNGVLEVRVKRQRARVDLLTTALTDALEGMQDMRPYVRDRFAEKWHYDEYIANARAVLSATPIGGEAPCPPS